MSITHIGFIGTGVMGSSMAGRLLAAGYRVTVHNRTKAKAQGLVDKGAAWADSPCAVADAGADFIITMVGYPRDVESTYFEGQRGIFASKSVPKVMMDMTTSSPELARRIAETARAMGKAALDGPVSGGDVGARNGTLSIMVGGEAGALEEVRPVLAHLGQKITHQGGAGSGQHTKMVNQMLIATNMIGVCEGLLYAQKAGLDPMKVLEAVSSGAAGSWAVSNLAPRIVKGDFEPGFYVEHFLKDMGIALEEARRMDLTVPGLALAEQLYRAVAAQGWSRKGTQALYLALTAMNGQKP